jgi:hypothetical protein
MSRLLTRLRHALRRIAVGDPPPPPEPGPPALLQRVDLSAVICARPSFPLDPGEALEEGLWDQMLDPGKMLHHVRGRASPRKLRLWCVACCRALLGPWLARDWCGPALDAAERFAEGRAGDDEREVHRQRAAEAHNYASDLERTTGSRAAGAETAAAAAVVLALAAYEDDPAATVGQCMRESASAPATLAFAPEQGLPALLRPRQLVRDEQMRKARAVQCELAREVFGHPFRPARIEPTWLALEGGAVASLARAIYHGGDFGEMPVLADALEEAGCADAVILGHCRSATGHVRGCWLLDGLLGKG